MCADNAPGGWTLMLPCTRAEAEAIDAADDLLAGVVLMTTETVADDAGQWRLDAYFADAPDGATLAAVRALVPSAGVVAAEPVPLADADWVTMSQAGLAPIRAGRFVVHTAAHPVTPAPGERAFRIEAGRAFGTGHHETTTGCLTMLDGMARERRFEKIIDLGTGTGLLAFAAVELWPMADVTATDIDPIAIEVARQNAAVNDIEVSDDIGEVSFLVADGTHDPTIARWAPYDLIIANILAAPLIAMADDIAGIAAPGATILLAGLLTSQADAVTDAYRAQGAGEAERFVLGDWTILRLTAAA